MDFKDHRVSPYSLVLVASLMACSQLWLPWVNQRYLEVTQSWRIDPKKSSEGIWMRGLSDVVSTGVSEDLAGKMQIQELRDRVIFLEKTLRQAKVVKKQLGQDLRLLRVSLLGDVLRRSHEVSVIDAGMDFNVSEKDWVLAGRDLVGRVVAVSESCALVESYTQSQVKTFVQVDGLEGEYSWEGQGNHRAVVYVKGHLDESVLNRSVYMSGAASREGTLHMGEVMGLQQDQEGGWWKLIVKGRKIQVDDILFVVQRIDPEMNQLFGNRDQIAELKQRLRDMELNRLRLELTKD